MLEGKFDQASLLKKVCYSSSKIPAVYFFFGYITVTMHDTNYERMKIKMSNFHV